MSTTTYDPSSRESRQALAAALIERLEAMKCLERPNIPATQEKQLARLIRLADGTISKNLQVVVYTTIVGREVRDVGKDAIRVALLYKCKPDAENPQGRITGVGSDTRVNRVGRICDIVARVCERFENVEKGVDKIDRCHCGAPKLVSKLGKHYCADRCWLR